MSTVRVLLVDDSSVARRAILSGLSLHPEVEVVATAPTGAIALARLPECAPDAVVLDVEMPGMDGVETLRKIRETHPRLPVIMFSALTERGAEVTVRALAAGASDYVCKPSAVQERSAQSVISEELVPKLLTLCRQRSEAPVPPPREKPAPVARRSRIDLLVIASSTGGPNALSVLLPLLPANLPVPVAIVQHMPPVFTRYLAERLDSAGPLPAREASGGELLEPGRVWIAPGNYHLEVERRGEHAQTKLTQATAENSCRPAADVLFRSAAATFGSRVLAVVLTGMGQDGLAGARAISSAGGQVLTQDEASCVVWGMPRAVEQAGLADDVLTLPELAKAIEARCNRRAANSEGAPR